jgi:MFS transporter, MFS domain-containing protein family, molybdate-anion transporter
MDFYKLNFVGFVLVNSLFTYVNWRNEDESVAEPDEKKSDTPKTTLFQFKLRFLPIYLLVNGADWLQVR